MPLYALVDCHWNGVEYAADDQIDISGYGPHALRSLLRSIPVYGVAPNEVTAMTFRTVVANTDAVNNEYLKVDATAGPITITPPAAAAGAQFTVTKTDGTGNAVTVTGFPPLTSATQSTTFIADSAPQWRILMAYNPQAATVSQINLLKQAVMQAAVTQAGSATPISPAAAGTFYEITGSTGQSIVLPAVPSSGTDVISIKCGPAYTGTITVTCQSGNTIDGASSVQISGAGAENLFSIAAGATDWQVG